MYINSRYQQLNKAQAIAKINHLAGVHKAFLFIIDYRADNILVVEPHEFDTDLLRFSFNVDDHNENKLQKSNFIWEIIPTSKVKYREKFERVVTNIHFGNSFLVNLTQPTYVNTDLSLLDLYEMGSAKYKLWMKDAFTVLSPECFVKIQDAVISSFPMKGTIDASVENAEKVILSDKKEQAEHATIVDLIRNDLSMVARDVEVKRYRYIDRLKTNKAELLQVSSEISGVLDADYLNHLGDILFTLLPAGSICGAPKPKTLEIIEKVEDYDRCYYTGVCGYFDGANLDSAVMIRFIEKEGQNLFFKSGGGITSKSVLDKEYEELIQKIYVPLY